MKQAKDHINRYSRFLKWLVNDLYANYRWRLFLVVVGNCLGLLFRIAAVYASYHYAKALETNSVLSWQGYSFYPRTSIPLLIVIACMVLLLTLISAYLVMRSRTEAIQLARDYTDFCSQRIYYLASRLPRASLKKINVEFDSGQISRLSRYAPPSCGMVVRILSFSLLPAGTFIVAGLALFLIDPWLSVMVIGILGLASIHLYRTSIQGASYRLLLERRVSGMSKEQRSLNERIKYGPATIDYKDIGMKDKFDRGITADFSKAFVGQRLVLEKSHLLTEIVAGISVFMIMIVQGSATLQNESNWSALLVYLVAFNFFATNFSKTIRMLTSINRFYPAVSRYALFVDKVTRKILPDTKTGVEEYYLDIPLPGTETRQFDLVPGGRFAFIIPRDVDRYMLNPLTESLRITGAEKVIPSKLLWFTNPKFSPVGSSIRQGFGFPDTYKREDLQADLNYAGMEHEFQNLPRNINKLISDNDARLVNPALSLILTVLSGYRSGYRIFVINEPEMALLPAKVLDNLMNLLKDSLVFIAYPADKIERLGGYNEIAGIFCDARNLLACIHMEDILKDPGMISGLLARILSPEEKPQQEDNAGVFADELDALL